jgi:hypothetical protein
MQHSTVIEHLNDEVGFKPQDLVTRRPGGPCTLCCQTYGRGAFAGGTDTVNSADKYQTHLSQHRTTILDKHALPGPGRRRLSRNQTLSCTVSSRIKSRFTLLEVEAVQTSESPLAPQDNSVGFRDDVGI